MNTTQKAQIEDLFYFPVMKSIKTHLAKNKETVAVAESVTSGLLQLAFGTIEDASFFYQGGITAYNLGQKYRHLLIEPIHAQECDCISQKVANEMAVNVCELFRSNWGISITGYSTPVKESNDKLFAYFTIVHNNKIQAARKIIPKCKDPFAVQMEYTNIVLQRFRELMPA